MEFQRLAALYAAKTDEELKALAADPGQLTLEAQSALRNEASRRQMSLVASGDTPVAAVTPAQRLNVIAATNTAPVAVPAGPFVTEVFRLYHAHLWLFLKLTAPAVLLGTLAILTARHTGREIAHHARLAWYAPSLSLTFLEIWLVNTIGWALSWTFFSFAFASIGIAVQQIGDSEQPTALQAFRGVFPRIGRFLKITLSLFLIFLVLIHFMELVAFGPMLHLLGRFSRYSFAPMILGVFFYMGVALIVSRFALAIPAVVLDGSRVGQSIFLSDELTGKKWTILTTLLTKSILGGYIAGMLPFWLSSWLFASFHVTNLQWWLPHALTAASVAAVSYAEPIMFIGFAMLYVRTKGKIEVSSPDSSIIAITTQ